MIKRIITLILLITFFSTAVVGANTLNFGNVSPESEFSKEIRFLIDDPSITGIELWLDKKISNSNKDYVLPVGRFRVKYKEDWLTIDTEPVRLELKDKFQLTFSLTLLPYDFPGNYQSILHLKKIRENGQTEKELLNINLKIKPWVKIKFKQKSIILNHLEYGSKELTNFIPGVIKIASNQTWNLFGRADNINNPENIVINILENDSYQVLQQSIKLTDDFKTVVIGERTTGKGYWVELPFVITITDFTRIPAGKFNFPVIFALKSIQD